MKGLSRLSSVVFALFLAAACGDDDDTTSNNGGGAGGAAGSSGASACKFPYADRTKATLKTATTERECAADTDAICGANMVQVASSCGVACNAQSTDPATVAACTKDCIQGEVTPKLSDGCTNCYVADVGCSIVNCAAECVTGATAACNTCRLEKGCTAEFYTCSGLPLPTSGGGGNGSGGRGNAGGAGGEIASGGTPSAEGGVGGSR